MHSNVEWGWKRTEKKNSWAQGSATEVLSGQFHLRLQVRRQKLCLFLIDKYLYATLQ